VTINREVIAVDDFESVLEPLLQTSRDHQVVVTCDDGVSHGRFVNLLDRTRRCGANNIAVRE
jgi:biopolymer transport protein ExbD